MNNWTLRSRILASFSLILLVMALMGVVAYNRLSASVNRYEAILQRFADRFNANLGRELERV